MTSPTTGINNDYSLNSFSQDMRDEDSSIVEMIEKARELFAVCDKEGKGFINRVDMQSLHGELPLSDEQLQEVFKRLDEDGNGFLTFQEFCDGFGGFLGQSKNYNIAARNESSYSKDKNTDGGHVDSADISNLQETLQRIMAEASLTADEEDDLWNRLKLEHNDSGVTVEELVKFVINELNETKREKLAMEKTLKERSLTHEDEVRQLYEEMEQQLREERNKSITEEVMRERALSLNLQNELKQKEQHLKELLTRQEKLDQEVASLSSGKIEVKCENAQLVQLNESLVEELQKTRNDLEDTRIKMEIIKQQKERQEDQENAEEEARKLDLEKKSLITQLQMLREMNRKLRDDKDEVVAQTKQRPARCTNQTSTPKQKYPLFTQGSNVGKYFSKEVQKCEAFSDIPVLVETSEETNFSNLTDELKADSCFLQNENIPLPPNGDVANVNKQIYEHDNNTTSKSLFNAQSLEKYITNSRLSKSFEKNSNREDSKSFTLSSFPTSAHNKQSKARARFYRKLSKDPALCKSNKSASSDDEDTSTSKFQGSIVEDAVKQAGSNYHSNYLDQYVVYDNSTSPAAAPDRVYKVVFVGNSGVGKTSLIQQFVTKTFQPKISATIGVDYQVKTVKLDEQLVALQLWDTAGQERFRSITRQYFRKADGIVVVYDVTNEKSFLAVRNWMQSVQEGADANSVIMLIGNKRDIASENMRQVTPKEGTKLAEEYGAMFSETSAKSGKNVTDCILSFAAELTRLEDEQRESVLSLAASDEDRKSKSCCKGKAA